MSDSYGTSSGPGSQPSASAAGASSPAGADPSREFYRFENGWTMQREGSGGLWHLRRDDALLIGRDQYRNDLINRHALEVAFHFDPAASAIETRTAETEMRMYPDQGLKEHNREFRNLAVEAVIDQFSVSQTHPIAPQDGS